MTEAINKIDLVTRFEKVRSKVEAACAKAGRLKTDVTLVAVSKTKPLEMIRDLAAFGHRSFGENYVQEAVEKLAASKSDLKLDWHFIGSLQTNKSKAVVGNFGLIHSVDRLKLALALSSAAVDAGLTQKILAQIQIGDEETKHGFSLDEAPELLNQIASLPGLQLCGLMALPPLEESETSARANFALLKTKLETWRKNLPVAKQSDFSFLSMGTSSDYEWAILEGATHVRVGTEIFGAR